MRVHIGFVAAFFVTTALAAPASADPTHCAAVLAKHDDIRIRIDGGVRVYDQYSQASCECILSVSAQHLPEVLVSNMKTNHKRGRLLAVGDPKRRGTLEGDRFFARLEALGPKRLQAYDRATFETCGGYFPDRKAS